MTPTQRERPLLICDWGSRHLGPRYTEIDGERTWLRLRQVWRDTNVGYVLHYMDRGGKYIPFKWRTSRNLPRPPRRR